MANNTIQVPATGAAPAKSVPSVTAPQPSAPPGTLTVGTLLLSKSAFETEHARNFPEALKLHRSAVNELEKSTHDGKMLRTEEVRLAKMQMKVHQRRVEAISAALTQKKEPELLPSINGIIEQAVEFLTQGRVHIGLEAKLLREWTNNEARPRPDPPAQITHLINATAPFYTPTLDGKLPTTTYYCEQSTESSMRNAGNWLVLKVKSKPNGEDVYQMHVLTRKNIQNATGTFYRAANLFEPVLQVLVQPLGGRPDASDCIVKGRPILISGPGGTTYERPDRTGREGWTPRRFEYGGRNFVWKVEGSNPKSSSLKENLYEQEKLWAKPGSKTGKMEDKCLARKLVWTDTRGFGDKYYKVHIVGGVDQLFQEYLLASFLARRMVSEQTSSRY